MRDWKRYEEAKRMRDTGLTLKATGEVLGVSGARVRDMLATLERRERYRAWEAENPRPKPWWDGLAHRTKYELERAGFDSRESCAVFAADDLRIWRGAAVFKDSDDADWWRWTRKRFPLAMVNEIRAWLGCQPFTKTPKATSAAELERARKLLDRNGWRVEPPNVGAKLETTAPAQNCDWSMTAHTGAVVSQLEQRVRPAGGETKMNIDDIKKRVAQIDAMKDDDESAHSAEDALLKDFVRHIAASGQDPFAGMAAEVLRVDAMEFWRWCA